MSLILCHVKLGNKKNPSANASNYVKCGKMSEEKIPFHAVILLIKRTGKRRSLLFDDDEKISREQFLFQWNVPRINIGDIPKFGVMPGGRD